MMRIAPTFKVGARESLTQTVWLPVPLLLDASVALGVFAALLWWSLA